MKSSSLKIAKEYGIKSPREYRDKLIHEWHIDSDHFNNVYTHCFLKEFVTSNVFDSIKDGEMVYDGCSYSVIWITGPKSIKNYPRCLLSFRWSVPLNCGYVLIKGKES
jgi:hypothetical protein